MNKQIVFLTFANSPYIQSLKRIEKEIEKFPFTKRYFFTEKDLPPQFLKQLHTGKYRRGYGYWRWKAYIIQKVLSELNYDDILIWSDAGNEWNIKGISRFNEYLELAQHEDSGIVCFQQPFLEKDYSKGDLLEYLGVYNNIDITMSLQLWGGAFIIRKTITSVSIINQWADLNINHPNLITDKKSVKPNLSGFIEHRHDQSTYSCLVKKYPHKEIYFAEVYNLFGKNDSYQFQSYPICGKRNKIKTKLESIKYKIIFPYRICLGLYLTFFEKMYFHRKFWW